MLPSPVLWYMLVSSLEVCRNLAPDTELLCKDVLHSALVVLSSRTSSFAYGHLACSLALKSDDNFSVFHRIGPKIAHFYQKFCSNRSIFVTATLILEPFYLVDSMQYFLCLHFDQVRIG